jgi:uncharacterized protein (TIGR02246 family)
MCRAVVPLIVGAAMLGACQNPKPFDPDDPAIAAEVESRLESALAGAAGVDADQVLAFADGEGELTFVTGDVMLSGLDTIRARFEETYAGLAKQEQVVLEKRVRLLSPDVALLMAVGEGTYTDKAGWTSPPVGIGLTIVFVQEAGVWRARHVHQSIAR